MRAVRGLERPAIQWAFVAVGLVLIVVALAEAVAIRRARADASRLRADALSARLAREELELRLTREQAAREALGLEVTRLRGPSTAESRLPTLTLTPLRTRGVTPPPPTVAPPSPSDLLALRLVLPPGADTRRLFSVAVRNWSTGETVWVRGALAATRAEGRPMVIARMAGDVLARGAYELILTVADGSAQPVEVAAYELTVG